MAESNEREPDRRSSPRIFHKMKHLTRSKTEVGEKHTPKRTNSLPPTKPARGLLFSNLSNKADSVTGSHTEEPVDNKLQHMPCKVKSQPCLQSLSNPFDEKNCERLHYAEDSTNAQDAIIERQESLCWDCTECNNLSRSSSMSSGLSVALDLDSSNASSGIQYCMGMSPDKDVDPDVGDRDGSGYRHDLDIISDSEDDDEDGEGGDDLSDEVWAHLRDRLNVDFEEIRRRRSAEAAPLYPHRSLLYMECQVCLSKAYLRRRVCCDFRVCRDCMSTYVGIKVAAARVQVECPNDRCHALVHRDEVKERLTPELRLKFIKFLVDANADPCKKTCPDCSEVMEIDPAQLKVPKKKLKNGLEVRCPQCKLVWCFLCQAPFHTGITCKAYLKGDAMLRTWAKEWSYGQFNAQKCPKCKVFIQKAHGCDHMKCTHCNTDFCYRCGDRYISLKLLGNHWSRFSIFGCKYRLLPKRPGLRKLIRGASFAARLGAGVVLAGVGLVVGAGLVGASVVIVPGYGILCLRRHLWRKRQRRIFQKRKDALMSMVEEDRRRQDDRRMQELLAQVFEDGIVIQSEDSMAVAAGSASEGSEVSPGLDRQQVQVIVHRSVSLNQEDVAGTKLGACGGGGASKEEREECGFFINKYTAEGSELVVVTSSKSEADGSSTSAADSVITVTDFKEIPSSGGYTTLVANIVSRPVPSGKTAPKVVNAADSGSESVSKELVGESKLAVKSSLSVEDQAGETSDRLKHPDQQDKLKIRQEAVESGERFADVLDDPRSKKKSLRSRTSQDATNVCCDPNCCFANQQNTTAQPAPPTGKYQEGGEVTLTADNSLQSSKSCGGYNGCFGNIFSKRSQQQPSLDLEGTEEKGRTQPAHKKGGMVESKASTWEKTRRDRVHALLLSSALSSAAPLGGTKVLDDLCLVSSARGKLVNDAWNIDISTKERFPTKICDKESCCYGNGSVTPKKKFSGCDKQNVASLPTKAILERDSSAGKVRRRRSMVEIGSQSLSEVCSCLTVRPASPVTSPGSSGERGDVELSRTASAVDAQCNISQVTITTKL